MPCSLPAPPSLLLVTETGKRQAENNGVPPAASPLHQATPPCLHASLSPAPRAHRSPNSLGRSGSKPFFLSRRLFPAGSFPGWLCPRGKGSFPHPAARFHRIPLPRPEPNSCSPKYPARIPIALSRGYGLYLRSQFKVPSI